MQNPKPDATTKVDHSGASTSTNDEEALHLPPPDIHTTGSDLRKRYVTTESVAALEDAEELSGFAKIARRFLKRK